MAVHRLKEGPIASEPTIDPPWDPSAAVLEYAAPERPEGTVGPRPAEHPYPPYATRELTCDLVWPFRPSVRTLGRKA